MMRSEYIRRVSAALGREALPPAPPRPPLRNTVHEQVMAGWSAAQLAEAFVSYSQTIGVAVYQTPLAGLNPVLVQAVEALGGGPCLLADQPLLRKIGTGQALASFGVKIWESKHSRQENIDAADRAAVGIAVAEVALAESATVMLFSGAGLGRSVTLLPPATILIVPQSVIRPRLTQAMALLHTQIDGGLPSSINLVSGPSATSDIELVRVVGVHGPMRVAHVVVKDL